MRSERKSFRLPGFQEQLKRAALVGVEFVHAVNAVL
jgi:hypothetical protein